MHLSPHYFLDLFSKPQIKEQRSETSIAVEEIREKGKAEILDAQALWAQVRARGNRIGRCFATETHHRAATPTASSAICVVYLLYRLREAPDV